VGLDGVCGSLRLYGFWMEIDGVWMEIAEAWNLMEFVKATPKNTGVLLFKENYY